MKRSYLPLILLPLLAILCGLLLWTDWQSGQSLRAARAEVQAMQSKMEQERLAAQLEISQQAKALADEQLTQLLDAYGLPGTLFDAKEDNSPERHFYLFNGIPFDPSQDVQTLEMVDASPAAQSYYTRFYYLWRQGNYQGTVVGSLTEEGRHVIQGLGADGTIACSWYYDAIPRQFTTAEENAFPLTEMIPHDQADYRCIDLDGDGASEVLASVIDSAGCASQIAMYRENGAFVGIIATLENGLWLGRPEELRYLELGQIHPFDLDGDGCMELILQPPQYEKPALLITGYDGQALTRAHDVRWSVTGE